MNLESLLNASLELEKRIATDQQLRKYFSTLWQENAPKHPASRAKNHTPAQRSGFREVKLTLPAEMCELLALASQATGKTQSEILETCFAEFYLRACPKM